MFYPGVRKFIIYLLSLFGLMFPLSATSDTLSLVTGEVLSGELEGIDWKKQSLFFRTAGRLESFSFDQVSRVNRESLKSLMSNQSEGDHSSEPVETAQKILVEPPESNTGFTRRKVKANAWTRSVIYPLRDWMNPSGVESYNHLFRYGYTVSLGKANLFENGPSSGGSEDLDVSGFLVGYQYLGWSRSKAPEVELYRKVGEHCVRYSTNDAPFTRSCNATLETKGARVGLVLGTDLRKRTGLALTLVPGVYFEQLEKQSFREGTATLNVAGGYLLGRANLIAKRWRFQLSVGEAYAFTNTYQELGLERRSTLIDLTMGLRFGG